MAFNWSMMTEHSAIVINDGLTYLMRFKKDRSLEGGGLG
jgi:hypothetical protein